MADNKYEGSKPENVLDKYRTFSYHHILMAAHNTEVFRVVNEDAAFFSLMKGKLHGQAESKDYDSNGKKSATIVMVINSLVDSHYTIEGINYTTAFAPTGSDAKAEGFIQIISQLNMRVKEPYGINFMNFLVETANDTLKVNVDNMLFMLKTIFVGHTHDGRTETVEIPPVILKLVNLSAAFDSVGGTYELSFVDLSNGAAFASQENIIKRNKQYTSKNGTLGEMITDLQDKLNEECAEAFNSMGKTGREVKYQIEIPDEWKNHKINGIAQNYVEQIFAKEEGAQAAAATEKDNSEGAKHVNGEVKISVIEMIRRILRLDEELYKQENFNTERDAEQKEAQAPIEMFKIETRNTSDDDSVALHYDVLPYYLPKLPNIATVTGSDASTRANVGGSSWFVDQQQSIPRYGMVLDYLFTGKNSHIKQFDMNFPEGMVYLHNKRFNPNKALNATKNGSNPQAAARDAKGAGANNPVTKTDPVPIHSHLSKDPIFPPILPAENAGGGVLTTTPAAAEGAQKSLANFINFYGSMMNTKVKIRGNPRLLSQTVRPLFPHDPEKYRALYKSRNEEAKKAVEQKNDVRGSQTSGPSGTTLTPNADLNGHYPMFVKFNIYTPNKDASNPAYAVPHEFWYNGWYYIRTVSNSFSDGDFEQELELSAYVVYGLDTKGKQQ